MKIQVVARPKNGCDYVRCVLPAEYLKRDTVWSVNNTVELLWIAQEEHLISCDILWYNKLIATPVAILKQWQSQGMKIVVDIDDMWVLPPGHAHYKGWMTIDQEGQTMNNCDLTIEHMKIADIVTCTSLRLQEAIRPYNKNTVVIPNALPFGDGLYQPGTREPHDKLGFLYAGGVSHLQDVQLLSGKFKRIGTDRSITDKAEFIMAGYEQVKEQKKMYKTREDMDARNGKYTLQEKVIRGPYDDMTAIFKQTSSYRVVPTMSPSKYMSVYDQADVVIAPLADSTWNSYKSTLKVLEASTRKLPIVCSRVKPYTDIDCDGLLLADNGDWVDYIKMCIREPQWRQDKGEQLAEYITANYHLNQWNEVRKQVYSKLVA